MSEPGTERRLAAILAADEAGTLDRLRALKREVIDPLMAEHGGRVFKTTGDGLLAEFPSAVQGLRCAIAIQDQSRANAAGLQLRIGLHQGDVVIEGDDVLGDGVNIAARIEPLAEAGGICISSRVREDAAGKIPLDVEDLGNPNLKNITQPIRVYRLRLGVPELPALALPEKSSLAVLPFQNMSGDPEQEYFADGIAEDITTALSRIRSLFVIARNSAFTYNELPLDNGVAGLDRPGRPRRRRHAQHGAGRSGSRWQRSRGSHHRGRHRRAGRRRPEWRYFAGRKSDRLQSEQRGRLPTCRHAESLRRRHQVRDCSPGTCAAAQPSRPKGRRAFWLCGCAFRRGRTRSRGRVDRKGIAGAAALHAALRYHAASLGLVGRVEEGRQAVQRILELVPDFTIARARRHIEFAMHNIFKTPGVADSFYEGLRRSGVPE